MNPWIRRILMLFGFLAACFVLLVAVIWWRYSEGNIGFPDRNTIPALAEESLEVVANLDLPPGNLAVSDTGRIFFSFHPEARPSIQVAELIEGVAKPYPGEEWQSSRADQPFFESVLSLRIDRQNRLWTLDNATHGLGQPRLLAFDLSTNQLVDQFDFPSSCAALGSHLNDFQVDPEGKWITIADASIFGKSPALVVYDIEHHTCQRRLENHASVLPEPFLPVVQGRVMRVFGIFAIQPGVDSIALDTQGEWLYYGAVTSQKMFRIPAAELRKAQSSDAELARHVETFAEKTMSDGLSRDLEGNLYLTDPEHSSIVRLDPEGALETLVQSDRLRWPDGLSFGPEGWLYVTASSLHHVIGCLPSHIQAQAPYQIFRFQPGAEGTPGH